MIITEHIGRHNKQVEDLLASTDYYIIRELEKLLEANVPKEIISIRNDLRSAHVGPGEIDIPDITDVISRLSDAKIKYPKQNSN